MIAIHRNVWAAVAGCLLILATSASAKLDLVTLPERDRVQLTIYNSADLTLVREQRSLTLSEGSNRLQFSWAETLIDPTSLELFPRADADSVTVQDLVYPPRTHALGIWNVTAERAGAVPMEISYFTSGIRWEAYYLATLDPGETHMNLEGYVRVTNQSGEAYTGAETRLVVGRINLVDRIASLARRQWPYDRPGAQVQADEGFAEARPASVMELRAAKGALALEAPKDIIKEGLSEYFLYTIEGTEDLPDRWSKRLISFHAEEIPVENLYRFEEERYGPQVVRFLAFANDAAHHLGKEPIPGGMVKVYRRLDAARHLTYIGAQDTNYVPIGEQVRLELGPTRRVKVEPILMATSTDNYEWKTPGHGRDSSITGWDETREVSVKTANTSGLPVHVEIRRNFPTTSWDVTPADRQIRQQKVDSDTVQFDLDLAAGERREFRYTVVLRHGTRAL